MGKDTPKDDNLERMSFMKIKYNTIILWHFSSWWILISREELKSSQGLERTCVLSERKNNSSNVCVSKIELYLRYRWETPP